VITGLGILITGYILLPCGIDAYHWQLAVYLAWFSAVTHLSGLTVLRTHLNKYIWAKYVRYGLMLSLLVLLVVGMVPTGLFSDLSKPALCYFYQSGNTLQRETRKEDDPDWQAMVLSVFLLIFGFVTRSIKLFRPFSATLRTRLRQPIGDWSKKRLKSLARPRSSHAQLELLRINLVFKPVLSVFFMLRLSFDLYSSTMFEVYWLLVILLWGNAKLLDVRNSPPDDKDGSLKLEENRWTFGQILPVILLIGPAFTILGIFAFHLTKREAPNSGPHIELNAFDEVGQGTASETIPTQSPSQDLESNESPIVIEQVGRRPIEAEPDDLATDIDSRKFDSHGLENYGDALWLPTCVGFLFFNVLAATLIAFSMVFFSSAGPEEGRTSLYELWISEFGFIYLLFISYPCACTTLIRLGLGMERWLIHARRQYLFLRICFVFYTLDFFMVVLPLSGLELGWLSYFGGLIRMFSMYFLHALFSFGKALFYTWMVPNVAR
ncbi:hypothetical protein GQ607_012019, partial [Colletotrichum asianum]